MKWAAMLRGINLGKRQLKKDELIAAAEALGYTGARTLLASGNLVFDAGDARPQAIERDLHASVEKLHGLKSDVFARNLAEIEKSIADNPFPDVARDRPSQLLVLFLRDPFPNELLDRIAESYDGPERLEAVGRELYIDFPEGQGRSRLVPAMGKLKGPICTGRNWNTVTKLAEMLAA
jgi:uncharacterized protein (DUF1697 family)